MQEHPGTSVISYGTADSGHCAGPFACNVQLSGSGPSSGDVEHASPGVNELLQRMRLGPVMKPAALGGKPVVALNARAGALQL